MQFTNGLCLNYKDLILRFVDCKLPAHKIITKLASNYLNTNNLYRKLKDNKAGEKIISHKGWMSHVMCAVMPWQITQEHLGLYKLHLCLAAWPLGQVSSRSALHRVRYVSSVLLPNVFLRFLGKTRIPTKHQKPIQSIWCYKSLHSHLFHI